jgi:hypothetical protein
MERNLLWTPAIPRRRWRTTGSNQGRFLGELCLAHNISDAQSDAPTGFAGETAYGLSYVNRFDISADRGNVDGTRRQRFLLTGTYDLPFGQGRHWSSSSGLVNRAFGGWSLNTNTLLETGPYLTPTINPQFDQTNTDPELAGSMFVRTLWAEKACQSAGFHSINKGNCEPVPLIGQFWTVVTSAQLPVTL